MITLKLTPEQYETICVALKMVDIAQDKLDFMFISESFKKVLDEIALETQEAKSSKE